MPTLETDQYIKREERRKLEKLKVEVRCALVASLPPWIINPFPPSDGEKESRTRT